MTPKTYTFTGYIVRWFLLGAFGWHLHYLDHPKAGRRTFLAVVTLGILGGLRALIDLFRTETLLREARERAATPTLRG